jgi:hypothetical protein
VPVTGAPYNYHQPAYTGAQFNPYDQPSYTGRHVSHSHVLGSQLQMFAPSHNIPENWYSGRIKKWVSIAEAGALIIAGAVIIKAEGDQILLALGYGPGNGVQVGASIRK